MSVKVLTHKVDVKRKFELLDSWNIKDSLRKDVRQFFEDYSEGKVTRRLGTNFQALLERGLSSLRPALESLNSFERKELERFLSDLIKDRVKSTKGKAYSHRSKIEIINILKRFVKWKGKDPSPLELIWGTKRKDAPSLTEEEVNKLFDACEKIKYRYFIAVLYASGARAEEFHNIRLSDINIPKDKKDSNNISLRLRKEYSKTHGRTIPLMWKKSLDAVRDYLSFRIEEGIKPDEPVFTISYDSMKKWINRHGKKVLGKPVNYHLFRHSRATHLASKMNRQQLCIFFGWKFSSPMPDIYIDRNGLELKEIEQKFDKTNQEDLEKQLDELKSQLAEKDKHLEKRLKEQEKNILKKLRDNIMEISGKKIIS